MIRPTRRGLAVRSGLALLITLLGADGVAKSAPTEPAPWGDYDGNHPVLAIDDHGKDVAHLQCLLNRGGANLAEDGVFGVKTEEAVKDYEGLLGLEVDGVVEPGTWAALHAPADAPAADCFRMVPT